MAGQTISINPDSTSSVKFRAWGSAISTAIGVNGQVQTADTGQINWTTVTVPAANASGGYEIWRFADSLQSSAPIYLKIEYGLNANAAPQIWLTVGTGSDGAGTITGAVSGVLTPQIAPRQATSVNSSSVAVANNSYVNGNSGCLAMFLFPNNNSAGWCGIMILLERTKDASGADTGDGLLILFASSGTSANFGHCMLTFNPGVRVGQTSLAYNQSAWPILGTGFTAILQSMSVNGVVYPAQVFTATGPKAGGPSQYVMAVTIGDIAAGQVVAISHYGTSRNWYAAGQGNTAVATGWGSLGGTTDMQLIKSFLFRIN